MAWPWLSIVARTIPWTELARRAPDIISASSELLNKRNAAARQEFRNPPDEADELEMANRIRSLEQRDAENARVVEQLAEQTRDLSDGLQVVAARLRLLTWVVAALAIFTLSAVLFWT
jgi:hypothetical protein